MTKIEEPRGCICYCCPRTGAEVSSMKVEAVHPSNWQGDVPTSNADNIGKIPLKSNLKKISGSSKDTAAERCPSSNGSPVREFNAEAAQSQEDPNCKVKRKVQWTDAHGKELTQVKEFERRFMQSPHESHWKAAKRILRYLKGTLYFGLEYKLTSFDLQLFGFSDSNWAGDSQDRKSTAGCVFSWFNTYLVVIHIDWRMKA